MRVRALGVVLAILLVASGCTGSSTPEEEQLKTLTVTAEEWPACLNPITECSSSRWLHWAVLTHTMPRAMEVLPDGRYVASPVLFGEPVVEGGQLPDRPDPSERDDGSVPESAEPAESDNEGDADPPLTPGDDFDPTIGFGAGPADPEASTTTTTVRVAPVNALVITYPIHPDAAWDDGAPITADDFIFTWRAALETERSLVTAGYDRIFDIDAPDSKTAVVTFFEPYAAWRDLFGGYRNYLLPAHAFSSPSLGDEMVDSLPVSAGPWTLTDFTDTEIRFSRNDSYWDPDRAPFFDELRVVALAAAEQAALEPDIVMYPADPGESVSPIPVSDRRGSPSSVVHAAWLNAERISVDARRAIAQRVDFPEISATVGEGFRVGSETCAPWASAVTQWCSSARADFDGAPLPDDVGPLVVVVPDGNAIRISVAEAFASGLQAGGLDVSVAPQPPAQFFGATLRTGDFDIAVFGTEAAPDPSLTARLSCDEIPTPENRLAGQNFGRWCNELATELMKEADQQVDKSRRALVFDEIASAIAGDVPFVALYQEQSAMLWPTGLFGSDASGYLGSHYGPYHNAYVFRPLAPTESEAG